MSRNGFRHIRAALKSERAFHARFEKAQREKLYKKKYGIELRRKKLTEAEYERIGEAIERDPLRHSILFQLEYLRVWQQPDKPN